MRPVDKQPAETNSSQQSRRAFVATAAGAVALASTARSYARVLGANDRIRVGYIGAGGMGNGHLDTYNALKEKNNLECLGVADCWSKRAEEGAAKVGAPAFTDYRKLIEIADIDYVTIATPEHWHAQMTLDAMDAGNAVYCEKPLTHSIEQANLVLDKQRATGRPVQVGVQGMSDDSYSSAAQVIADGMLGQVVQAQIEYVRRYDKQGPWRDPDISDQTPQPEGLDWKQWLGKAPPADWNPHHYFEWRCYSQYSGGICTDLFIHRLTRVLKACKLTIPRRVVGMGGIWQWPDGRDLPDNFEMICEYPEGMTVYVLGTMSNRVPIDHLIRGYRATLQFTGSGWVVRDKDGKVLAKHEKTGAEDLQPHHTNLHQHLREGVPLNCPVELGMYGVVATNMANYSWRTGQMMAWDAENRRMIPAHTLPSQDLFRHPPEETAAAG